MPGDKFDEPRSDIRQTLSKLENILDESLKGVNLFRHKCDIYLYYKRQFQAYQHLLQEGITTEKGEKHLREHEHWKKLASDEINKMLTGFLNTVFTRGSIISLTQ